MTKKFDLITIGGATQDIAVNLEDYQLIDNHQDLLAQRLLAIEYGSKVIAKKSFVEYGGGAANAAIAATKCGLKVASLFAIGTDRRGQDIVDNLKKNRISTILVKNFPNQQSAMSLVIIGRDGEHTIIAFRGANDLLKITSIQAKNLNSDWLYISSLSGANWLKNLTNLAASGKKIAWNPGQQQLSAGLTKLKPILNKTEILIVNRDEALQLLASQRNEKNKLESYNRDISQTIKRLWFYGPQLIIITNDKDGVWAFAGQELFHQKALKVKKIIDTTGVGDAFGATLTASLIKKISLEHSLLLAAQQSAAVLTKQGAQNGLIDLSSKMKK